MRWILLTTTVVFGLVGGGVTAGATDDRGQVLALHGPAIVRVEAVLKTKFNLGGQGDERDSRLDLTGTVVDPGGLVMVWNSRISSTRLTEMMQLMGGSPGFSVEITPIDFKVYLREPNREVRAFLAATDSHLDLAFLQLEEPPDAPLPFVDFREARRVTAGEEVVAIARLGRKFDDAPFLQSARIAGELEKPRSAWIVDGLLSTFGLPVFSLDGRPIGALTTILSRVGDDAGNGSLSLGQMMSSMMGPAAGGGPIGSFILPGDRVQALIIQAKERANELMERTESRASDGEEPE